MDFNLMALNETIKKESQFVERMLKEVSKVVVGQKEMLEGIMMGLLTGGHVLLEGVPGLAKTLTISSISKAISLGFQRIQFTPDLLPTDLIGTMIFNPKSGEFTAKKGPIFTNIVLADEINRAPAKVQSALLEAMAEKQVTIGDTTDGRSQVRRVSAIRAGLSTTRAVGVRAGSAGAVSVRRTGAFGSASAAATW